MGWCRSTTAWPMATRPRTRRKSFGPGAVLQARELDLVPLDIRPDALQSQVDNLHSQAGRAVPHRIAAHPERGWERPGLDQRQHALLEEYLRPRPRKYDAHAAYEATPVCRHFAAELPNELWLVDIERHEALLNRGEVQDLLPQPVAEGRYSWRQTE